jgi:NitT/TauT family transport system substrate-binding protein
MNTKRSFYLIPVIAALTGVLFLTACAGNAQPTPTVTKDTINYQMGWVHEYSSAPFYMAVANGHYAKENLDVTLGVGGFGESGYIDPVEQVVSGAADFSEASVFALLEARAQGKPIVAIATLNQRSPFAVISLAETGIVRPQDLAGKTVAIAAGGAELELDALLRSQTIDASTLNVVERTTFGIDPLVNGEVDAFGGWIINEGVALEESGAEPSFLLLSDYGIDTYDLLIFTTEDMVANHPEKVERFLRATLAGLQDTIDDPEKAIDVTLTYDKALVRDEQLRRLQAFIPLIQPAGTKIGTMQPEIWEFNYQVMLDGAMLTEAQDVTKAYTSAFLDKIYSAEPAA